MQQIDAAVDSAVAGLVRREAVDEHTAALRSLGGAAVPRLLAYLQHPDERHRRVAFYGLQYCWSSEAIEPVVRLLADPDPDVRRNAAIVLDRGEGRDYLARRCAALVDHPDPGVAGDALDFCEPLSPDLERMQRLLQREDLLPCSARHLSRYYAPRLREAVRALLEDQPLAVSRAALVALIHQNDRSAPTLRRMTALLSHDSAEARELAAEFLTWHGSAAHVRALEEAHAGETDLHAAAAIVAALAAIRRREARGDAVAEVGEAVLSGHASVRSRYESALAALRAAPGGSSLRAAFEVYARAEPFEPSLRYKGRKAAAEFIATRQARLALQAALFAIPGHQPAGPWRFRGAFDEPPSRRQAAPARSCERHDPIGYGFEVDEGSRVFSRLVHVGEDVCWEAEHRTVVAIGCGLVRFVGLVPSWGHVVVIEHEAPVDRPVASPEEVRRVEETLDVPLGGPSGGQLFCSVYAHLGPFICVCPGESVEAGQKLGSIGRAYTWENGGYDAHLHFALHLGPYVQLYRADAPIDVRYRSRRYRGRVVRSEPEWTDVRITRRGKPETVHRSSDWLCGYVSRWYWKKRAHGWLDPGPFLGETGE